MKKLVFALMYCLAVPAVLYAQETDLEADKAAITTVIEDYSKGADDQDAERTGRALHENSWQHVFFPNGPRTFNKETYLQLLEAKRIGGDERAISVESIDITEGTSAAAKVILTGSELVFVHYMGLLKVEGQWQIMSTVTVAGRAN